MELEDEDWDIEPYLVNCTCEHDAQEHDWSGCQEEDCNCEGHWEE
jgi:hypothetical protein